MTGTSPVLAGPQPARGHLKPLDGVRGLAILMVIFSHAFQSNSQGNGAVTRFIGDFLGYGIFGVDLFFVLSGFLITGILVDSIEDRGFFRKFYARRTLRIFPLYYGVLLVLFLLTPLLHLQWNGMGWLMVGYLQNLDPRIVAFSPGAGIGLNHFWSLAIEEQFYLVWPAIVFLGRDRRKLLWMTLAISGAALVLRIVLLGMGVSQEVIHITTVTRADSLLLGGALSLVYRSKYWPRMLRVAPYGFMAAAAVILVSIKLLGHEFGAAPVFSIPMLFWINGPRYTILALGSVCLIAWSLRPGSLCGWIFQMKWLRFFGKYSYGIYVLHMIALPLLLRVQRAWILQVTHSKLLAVVGAGFSLLFMSVVAAYLSFHLYEKPFLRLKHYFDYSPKATGRVSGERSGRMGADLINS